MFNAMKRHLDDDQGIALVVVIGAITLISVFAVGGYALASQSLHSTVRLQTESAAFQVASSGMDRELALFSESNFQPGQPTYQKSGSTPDGSYLVQVGRDPSVPYKYSIIATGTALSEQAAVRQDFFHFDLWSTNIAAGTNPAMGPVGSASQWNGSSTISGPFYVGGDCDFNSNLEFVGGPLFATGSVELRGGVGFTPIPTGSKYMLFAGGGCSGAPSSVKVYNTCPQIDLPWLDETYVNAMRAASEEESSDNESGAKSTVNTEVDTAGNPASYTGTKATGATLHYKVIDPPSGEFILSGGTASFGKVTKVDGVAMTWDDFAFDTDTNTLFVEGVVFVDGDVTIGSGVQWYRGNGLIVSTGNIDVGTGGTFQPWGGDDLPDDLTPTTCLGLVANNDINLTGGVFEGIVFANGDLNIDMNGTLQGAVHAHAINSLQPHTDLFMETNMSPELLPNGTPGSTSDPRGAESYSGGVVIPGTWSRIQ